MPKLGILINIRFKINFKIPPIDKAITGILNIPNPCKAPFTVCINTTIIIFHALIFNNSAPKDAFGNKIFKIISENTLMQIDIGNPINIVANIDFFILLFTDFISFFSFKAVIVGISVVAIAILNEYGSEIKVSTLPLNIPY